MKTAKNESRQGLVLGGGGVTGIAWMTGLLLGLQDDGIDLCGLSDVFVGTSAGATVGAQISNNIALDDLFQRQIDPARQVEELAPKLQLLEQMRNSVPLLFKIADVAERTRQIGEIALNADTVPEDIRRTVIAARLPLHHWPDRTLKIVAVDAASGEARIFDRLSGVDLVDAVAASCAVPGMWPPVSIGGRRYMDGGVRSSDNADLAEDCKRVIVISPMGAGAMMLPSAFSLSSQIESLQQSGAQTHIVEPDEATRNAIGENRLSPQARVPAAQAGRAQGRAISTDLRAFMAAHG